MALIEKRTPLQRWASCVCHMQIEVKQSVHRGSVSVISLNQPIYIVEKNIPEMEEWVISVCNWNMYVLLKQNKSTSICEVLMCFELFKKSFKNELFYSPHGIRNLCVLLCFHWNTKENVHTALFHTMSYSKDHFK